jgi:FtsP/CotA-like multicopper oxidase with cupredoxin domain
MGMEAFMDTPVINGTLYPYLEVDPTVVRFRILNAANDRFINLQFFVADPSVVTDDGRMYTEVKMVPAQETPGFPELWPTDGRVGGVPDPKTAGPSWIQIGNEGGFLPAPVVIPPQPMTFVTDAGLFNVGNVQDHSLLIGTAERADVLVDFSQFAGKTLILYNDSTAPFPAYDPRYDYYTGDEDLTSSGGTPTTQAGYGPNIRTVMQVRVKPADNPAGGSVHSIEVSNAGSGYSRVPSVSIFGGGGTGATATATGAVDRISVLDPGSGLTSAPIVSLVGGGGSGATAVANVSNGQIVNIQVTNGGSGYTSAPTVLLLSPVVGPYIYYLPLIYGGSGGGSTPPTSLSAVATLRVDQITLTNGGANYTTAPIVQLAGGGGFGASAYANLGPGEMYDLAALEYVFMKTADKAGVFDAGQHRIIIPQAAYNSAYNETMPGAPGNAFVQLHEFEKTFFNGPLSGLTITNGGLGYTSAPAVVISGGGGTGAEATAVVDGVVTTLTLTNGGTSYTTAPTVEFSGGGGTGAEATAGIVGVISTLTVTNGGTGYTSAPMVMFHGGGGTGAAATAVIDGGVITELTLENPGTGYTSAPMVMFSGGGGTGAEATAEIIGVVSSLTLTDGGAGYTSAPTVTFLGGGGTGAEATAGIEGVITALILDNPGDGYTTAPTVTISGGGGSGATAVANGYTIPLEPKAIQDEMGEAFDEYGRMSGFLGLELPVTSAGAQVFVLYPYSSPPVDIMRDSSFTQLGSLDDGTQIWKITHNGVDTHTIHIHLVNAQLINRVAWDGLILPPDANELGWKETIRVNPLEHTIFAFRPTAPTQPFDIPNSIRLIDPSMPEGALLMGPPLGWQDPLGGPVVGGVLNQYVNFGWEYVYHCHLLSHEEMDMMHSLSFGVRPLAPSGVTAVLNGTDVDVTWTDNSNNETYFTIFRSVSLDGPWVKAGTVKSDLPTTFTDSPPESGTYYYMVTASNLLGYVDNDTFVPFTNFPTEELISEPAFTEGGVVVP